ncbi:endonuclease domain-containing protein [Methylobacterium sp. J-070]|uniref:endonuclease domain-containing protein n=1 Tax=Methylobacterium sp. J-070 TaxID=2836650 RepID=UPI001FBAD203|nr:DUF559 domain-containing protein [Methylobacterium sp. J-070]MCJ2048646.1 DUF559 domain-containing protein [Methylobacterium sp. J-070]
MLRVLKREGVSKAFRGPRAPVRENAGSSGRFGAAPSRRLGEQVDPAGPPSAPEPDHREAKHWRVLRNRALNGWKFRRPCPIDRFIVDFACVEARPVGEVDGATHSTKRELLYDAARARIMETCGFALLHVLNGDIHQDLDAVRETIWAALPPGDPV